MPAPPPLELTLLDLARRFVGLKEVAGVASNPAILAMLRLDQAWPGGDEVPWCSAYINYIAWLGGATIPRSRSLAARSWLKIGTPQSITNAAPGFDIAILSRGTGPQPGPEVIAAPGHVGFYLSAENGSISLLGGNQGNREPAELLADRSAGDPQAPLMRQISVAWTGGIPGFGDARPDGRWVIARPGLDVQTDRGPLPQPNGHAARYLTLPPTGLQFACTWSDVGPDRAKEWTGTQWLDRGLSCGTNAVIYDNAGTLRISHCESPQGPLGWRYVTPANALVTCESTYADPTRGIYEWTAWPDLRIGQGGKPIQGAVVWFPDLGLRRLSFLQLRATGALRNIRARRVGDAFAITVVDYDQHLTTVTWATLAELRALPPVMSPDPPDPPEPPMPAAKATIASFDALVTLPATAEAIARITQGAPERFRWQYQMPSGSWVTEREQPATDLTVEYHFPQAGRYAIRLQTLVNGVVVDQSSSTSRVVTVLPQPDPPDPPDPLPGDKPTYDRFVNVESPQVASTFAHAHGTPPGPSDMGHNSYRRLALGWTAAQVQAGIVDLSLNFDTAPWFGWVPVDYPTFVNHESVEVAQAYRATFGPTRPTPNDLGHCAWRRFAEFWTHRDILHDIHGEPLEDGGAGGEHPPTPPAPIGRPGQLRGQQFVWIDDAGPLLLTAQTLFWGFYGYQFERVRYEQHLACTGRLSQVNRMIVCGLKKGAIERSLLPTDPWFDSAITGSINLSYDSYGQRVGVTIFGATYSAPTEADQRRVVERVATAIRVAGVHKVAYVEIANEGWTNGFEGQSGRDRLFRLTARLAELLPEVLRATTCPAPADDITKAGVQYYYKGSKASVVTEHPARKVASPDGIFRPTKKPWREKMFVVEGCPLLRINQEPRGPESSGTETNDPLVLAMDAIVTWLSGEGGYTLHCGAGIYGLPDPRGSGAEDDRPANLWETPNYEAIIGAIGAMRALLPLDLANWTKHDSFSGPFTFVDVPEEQFSAAYSATRGSGVGQQMVCPVWGVVRTTTWTLKQGRCNGRMIDPVSGAILATFDRSFTVTPQQRAVLVLAERTA